MRATIFHSVFSGGGAKGANYPGVHYALKKTGLLSSIQKVSGASAGASTAAFIAVGMDSHYFRKLLLSTNYLNLLGKWSKKSTPGISLITKDGKPLEIFIRTHITHAFKKTLEKIAQDKPEKNTAFEAVQQKIMSSTNPKITFRDLKICADLYPGYFKELGVTAIKYPNSDLKIFNYEKTPDVEIAIACRASASLPVILEPIEIEGQLYMDGGYFDNLPNQCFPEIGLKNTLLFAFGEGGNHENAVFQALYGKEGKKLYNPGLFEQLKRNILPSVLADLEPNYKNTDQKEATYQKIRKKYPLRTVELRTGKIKTTDFERSQAIARQLSAFGYLDTINYIINHDLADETVFSTNSFFSELLEKFNEIFQEIQEYVAFTDKDLKLCEKLKVLKIDTTGEKKEITARELFYHIKEKAEKHPNSPAGFSLTCAVELQNGWLSKPELMINTYVATSLKKHKYGLFAKYKPNIPENMRAAAQAHLDALMRR